MARYIEVMPEVNDFDVLHEKEEWILVTPQNVCAKCHARFTDSTSLTFHYQREHIPTGYEFIAFVNKWFSLQE